LADALNSPATTQTNRVKSAAASLSWAGLHDIAASLQRRALQAKLDHDPLNSLILAQYTSDLAMTYSAQGDFEQAAETYRAALDLYRRMYGGSHARTAQVLSLLGVAELHARDLGAAERTLRRCIGLYESLSMGAGPPVTLARNNLACVLIAAQRPEEARPIAGRTLEDLQSLFGREHVFVAEACHTLALALIESGDPVQAEPLLRRCLELRERLAEREDRPALVAEARNTLGYCLAKLERYDEAEPLLLQSHVTIVGCFGPADYRARQCLDRLVSLYENWSQPEQADRWRRAIDAGDVDADQPDPEPNLP
jgi:tetratricopeptide (TPR) repeat protein